jgi:peptide/nickel transport system substrate-binding protein
MDAHSKEGSSLKNGNGQVEDGYAEFLSGKPLGRRRFIVGAAAGGAGLSALALVGCGDDDDDDDAADGTATEEAGGSPTIVTTAEETAEETAEGTEGAEETATATATVAEQVQTGGTWRTFMAGDPTNLDPFAGTSYTTQVAASWAYSRLLRYQIGPGVDPALRSTEPDLAESIEPSPDILEYVVNLREGVMWHPPVSREFDAEDVVYSYQRYFGLIEGIPANPASAILAQSLANVEAVDSHTVKFTMSRPRGEFLVTEKFILMMPRETGTAFDPALQMVGTGPWIFDTYTPGSVLTFNRNPDWHLGPDLPYMERVEINFIPEYATRLNQFLGGNLDEIDILGQDLGRVIDENESTQILTRQAILPGSYISFEGAHRAPDAPWRDDRVRKAVSMAIDRDALLDAAYNFPELQELGLPVERVWNTDVPASEKPYWLDPKGEYKFEPDDPDMTEDNKAIFAYNPEQAMALLEAAGYGDGFSTKFAYTSARYGQAYNILTELMQQYLGQVGITLELEDQDYSSVFIVSASQGEFMGLIHIPRGPGGLANFEGYYLPEGTRNNAKVDDPELSDAIREALTLSDLDELRRAVLDLQNQATEKSYYVHTQLGATGEFFGYQPEVRNALDYQTIIYDFGNESVVHFWKA